jgi:hypothetical protein
MNVKVQNLDVVPFIQQGVENVKREENGAIDVHFCFRIRGRPAAFLALTSPSASHRLALTNWMTLITCLNSMIGVLTTRIIQGTVESILFARANSKAPALYGFMRRELGLAGFPG